MFHWVTASEFYLMIAASHPEDALINPGRLSTQPI